MALQEKLLKAGNVKVGTERVVAHTIDLIVDTVLMKGYLIV